MSAQLRQRKCFECSSKDSRSHWFWFRLLFHVLLVTMEAAKPEEIHLRHVETDVLIPKMMREKAKERCVKNVEAFNLCCKDNGFFMVFKCREENAALKECLTLHYRDPVFFEECKQEYIREKLEFLRTGVPTKNRQQKIPTSM